MDNENGCSHNETKELFVGLCFLLFEMSQQSYNLLCLNQTRMVTQGSSVSNQHPVFQLPTAQMPPILMLALGQSFLMGRAVILLSPESVALARLGVFIISPAGSCLRKVQCLKELPLYLKIQYNLFSPLNPFYKKFIKLFEF